MPAQDGALARVLNHQQHRTYRPKYPLLTPYPPSYRPRRRRYTPPPPNVYTNKPRWT